MRDILIALALCLPLFLPTTRTIKVLALGAVFFSGSVVAATQSCARPESCLLHSRSRNTGGILYLISSPFPCFGRKRPLLALWCNRNRLAGQCHHRAFWFRHHPLFRLLLVPQSVPRDALLVDRQQAARSRLAEPRSRGWLRDRGNDDRVQCYEALPYGMERRLIRILANGLGAQIFAVGASVLVLLLSLYGSRAATRAI